MRMKKDMDKDLRFYNHISMKEANKLHKERTTQLYKIVTVNWTCATENGKTKHNKVHYNEYITTIEKMDNWILNCDGQVWEEIISVEKIKIGG
jgi:hypothetical protein